MNYVVCTGTVPVIMSIKSIIMYYVAEFQIILGANGDVSPGPSRQKISTLIDDDASMWLNQCQCYSVTNHEAVQKPMPHISNSWGSNQANRQQLTVVIL